jgi:hypothetical protein
MPCFIYLIFLYLYELSRRPRYSEAVCNALRRRTRRFSRRMLSQPRVYRLLLACVIKGSISMA